MRSSKPRLGECMTQRLVDIGKNVRDMFLKMAF